MAETVRVYLEVGGKRSFASAADWPGWARPGKTEQAALDALAAYAPRYAKVAKLAKVDFLKDPTHFSVVERSKGDASTDYGVPGTPAKDEASPPAREESDRMLALLQACWKYLDAVKAKAPEALRKGPRGGGRDRDKMYQHVVEAEVEYAKRVGLRLQGPDRKAMLERFANPHSDGKWPVAYAVRRTAWHALDHAWEMEDRIP